MAAMIRSLRRARRSAIRWRSSLASGFPCPLLPFVFRRSRSSTASPVGVDDGVLAPTLVLEVLFVAEVELMAWSGSLEMD